MLCFWCTIEFVCYMVHMVETSLYYFNDIKLNIPEFPGGASGKARDARDARDVGLILSPEDPGE